MGRKGYIVRRGRGIYQSNKDFINTQKTGVRGVNSKRKNLIKIIKFGAIPGIIPGILILGAKKNA